MKLFRPTKPAIITRRALLTGAAAVAAYGTLPADATMLLSGTGPAGAVLNAVDAIWGVGNTIAWWDVSDAATITGGATPTAIADKSSNGYGMTVPSGDAAYSTTGLGGSNNKPSITVSGTGFRTGRNVVVGGFNQFAVFEVAKLPAGGSTHCAFFATAGGADYNLPSAIALNNNNGIPPAHGAYSSGGLATTYPTFAGSLAAGAQYALASVFDGTNHTLYLNALGPTPSVAFSGSLDTTGQIWQGNRAPGGEPLTQPWGETIWVKTAAAVAGGTLVAKVNATLSMLMTKWA